MEYNNLLELIKTVSESNISGFQYEDGDTRIVIATGDNGLPSSGGDSCKVMSTGSVTEAEVSVVKETTSELKSKVVNMPMQEKKQFGNIVKSPLVGTFYAAPSEDAEPFVKVGDRVKKGQIIAIVEAMKLMNEIESEYDGVITEILVDNATGVEYGEALFVVE